MVELQDAKLISYGKNEAGGMKDKWKMTINNHESIGAGVNGTMSVILTESCQGNHMTCKAWQRGR
jgi:hypothetical protein